MNKEELTDVLKRGNGIALICVLVECPNCNKNIWVEIGQHCGYDGVLDCKIETDCYECCKPIKMFTDLKTEKFFKFMTISELVKLQSDNFIKNYKNE